MLKRGMIVFLGVFLGISAWGYEEEEYEIIEEYEEELEEEELVEKEPEEKKEVSEAKEEIPEAEEESRLRSSLSGEVGLFRVISADSAPKHTFRVGLHSEFFIWGKGGIIIEKDENRRISGTLHFSYTPLEFLEAFFSLKTFANRNLQGRPTLFQTLGDMNLGAKLYYPLKKWLYLGGRFNLMFLNKIGNVGFDGDATSVKIGILGTADLRYLYKIPLRFHLNFGYFFDNSSNLVSEEYLPLSPVERFALGINFVDSLSLGVGASYDFPYVTPFGEFVIHFPIARQDFRCDPALTARDVDFGCLSDLGFAGWHKGFNVGVRIFPIAGLTIDVGVEIGGMWEWSQELAMQLPYNIILGLQYGYETKRPPKVITKEVVKTVEVPKGPTSRIIGKVYDKETNEPIKGAVISFPGRGVTPLSTEDQGQFVSYPFDKGEIIVEVEHPDFKPGKFIAKIIEDQKDIDLNCPLEPLERKGKISGKITDEKNKPLAAKLFIEGPEKFEVDVVAGEFAQELKAGAYILRVEADKYFSRQRQIEVVPKEEKIIDFILFKKPRRPLVRILKNKIIIKRKIHFETGSAKILPDSRVLLAEIADTLLTHPEIKKVEIGGHTDDRGGAEYNLKLSQSRAEAVRKYLIEAGISSDRLIAKGYGLTRPLVPNITARNRAKNRRVEFRILEREEK